jgi:hypothetical protein
MKRTSMVMAVIAVTSLLLSMTGCDMQVRDKYVAPPVSTVYVGLGSENILDITSVKVDGVAQSSLVDSSFKPSAWNATGEFKKVTLKEGQSVIYTFTQPVQGEGAWNSWSLAFWDDNDYGNFLRGDNWLNVYSDAGFTSYKWVTGGSSANGIYSNEYTYLTAASMLDTSATVTLTVSFDGTDITVVEAVGGKTAYTATSSAW